MKIFHYSKRIFKKWVPRALVKSTVIKAALESQFSQSFAFLQSFITRLANCSLSRESKTHSDNNKILERKNWKFWFQFSLSNAQLSLMLMLPKKWRIINTNAFSESLDCCGAFFTHSQGQCQRNFAGCLKFLS